MLFYKKFLTVQLAITKTFSKVIKLVTITMKAIADIAAFSCAMSKNNKIYNHLTEKTMKAAPDFTVSTAFRH